LDKARFANEFRTSFTVVGLSGMFVSCCIRGHRSRLFTSSGPGRILGLTGTVLRLVGRAGPALRLNPKCEANFYTVEHECWRSIYVCGS